MYRVRRSRRAALSRVGIVQGEPCEIVQYELTRPLKVDKKEEARFSH